MNATSSLPDPRSERDDLDEAMALLSQAIAEAPDASAEVTGGALRRRLLDRIGASAARHRGFVTVRRRHTEPQPIAAGATLRRLYAAADAGALRPGEPLSVGIVELAPGARLDRGLSLAACASEWLVLRGALRIDEVVLGALDHHRRAATATEPVLVAGEQGALAYLRQAAAQGLPSQTSRAADAVWEEFAPGIRRRVLWQQDGEIGYLARAIEGAAVPSHGHRHDEECLMLEGDLFLGDVLIREGDFQLAPAGLVHGVVQAGSDCTVYIRGDAELAFDLGEPPPA